MKLTHLQTSAAAANKLSPLPGAATDACCAGSAAAICLRFFVFSFFSLLSFVSASLFFSFLPFLSFMGRRSAFAASVGATAAAAAASAVCLGTTSCTWVMIFLCKLSYGGRSKAQ